MARRLHVPHLHLGSVTLPEGEAHHARDVLRLEEQSIVEVFDDAGQVARGKLRFDGSRLAHVSVEELLPRDASMFHLSVAAAVPKGERADWMVEKLSELGVAEFIPLKTDRSIVLPGGANKRQRWERLAIEAAKQSRRVGVMRIGELATLAPALKPGCYLSTEPGGVAIGERVRKNRPAELRLFIGPEGGWTDGERASFEAAGLTAVKLTDTILRIETAAVAAAAVVMCAMSEDDRR